MEELLAQCKGKKIDVAFGTTAVYRGSVLEIANGILYLKDDDGRTAYISVDKIVVFSECSESASRPGFIV
jgi:hypothetical protein